MFESRDSCKHLMGLNRQWTDWKRVCLVRIDDCRISIVRDIIIKRLCSYGWIKIEIWQRGERNELNVSDRARRSLGASDHTDCVTDVRESWTWLVSWRTLLSTLLGSGHCSKSVSSNSSTKHSPVKGPLSDGIDGVSLVAAVFSLVVRTHFTRIYGVITGYVWTVNA